MYFILRCTRIHNPEYGSIIHGHDSHHFNGRHSSSADEGFTSGSSPVNGMGGISGSGQGNLVLSPQSSADTTHLVSLSSASTSSSSSSTSSSTGTPSCPCPPPVPPKPIGFKPDRGLMTRDSLTRESTVWNDFSCYFINMLLNSCCYILFLYFYILLLPNRTTTYLLLRAACCCKILYSVSSYLQKLPNLSFCYYLRILFLESLLLLLRWDFYFLTLHLPNCTSVSFFLILQYIFLIIFVLLLHFKDTLCKGRMKSFLLRFFLPGFRFIYLYFIIMYYIVLHVNW